MASKFVDLVHPDLDGVIAATEGQARVLAKSGWCPADTTADEQDPTPTPRRGRKRAADSKSEED